MTRSEILDAIKKEATEAGVDPSIMTRQCGAESAFKPDAKSGCGACGLFQLLPATAKEMGCSDPFDPAANIRAAARYNAWLLRYYEGDYTRALAAYNWGLGKLNRLMRAHPDDWRDHLPDETANYLKKILEA